MGSDLLQSHLGSGLPHDVDAMLWNLYHAVVEEKLAKRGADAIIRAYLVDDDKKNSTMRELSETAPWKRWVAAVENVEQYRKQLHTEIEIWAVGTANKGTSK